MSGRDHFMTALQENEIRRTMSGFTGVWQRVTGNSEEAPEGPIHRGADLKELLRQERMSALSDARLAQKMRGSSRAVLLRHASAARRRGRRLRAEYFIQEGICDRSEERKADPNEVLPALRRAYQRDLDAARDYRSAALHTDSKELKALYQRFGEEREQAAREKRAIIVASFCP